MIQSTRVIVVAVVLLVIVVIVVEIQYVERETAAIMSPTQNFQGHSNK